jgi:hypothetical protein
MKKYFFLMALMAIAPLSLISCGGDDDDSSNDKPAVNLPVPASKADAAKYNLTPIQVVLKGTPILLERVELTESGNYLVAFRQAAAATRADNALEYQMGTFSKNGESFFLSDFATLTFHGKSGTSYNVLVDIDGQTSETEATKASAAATGEMTDLLCRTWSISNTRLRGTIGSTKIAKDFPGPDCNMNDLIEYIKEKGIEVKDKIEDNHTVKSITFTAAGTYLIAFNRKAYDVGTWRWSDQANGNLRYEWEDKKNMGYSIETGVASVTFDGSQCKLTLKCNANGAEVELVYTLH